MHQPMSSHLAFFLSWSPLQLASFVCTRYWSETDMKHSVRFSAELCLILDDGWGSKSNFFTSPHQNRASGSSHSACWSHGCSTKFYQCHHLAGLWSWLSLLWLLCKLGKNSIAGHHSTRGDESHSSIASKHQNKCPVIEKTIQFKMAVVFTDSRTSLT